MKVFETKLVNDKLFARNGEEVQILSRHENGMHVTVQFNDGTTETVYSSEVKDVKDAEKIRKMSIAQHLYTPKLTGWTSNTLILSSLFETESCLDYAIRHRFNVLLTETASAVTAEAIAIFIKKGFKMQLEEEENIAPDGTALHPHIYFKFIHPANN